MQKKALSPPLLKTATGSLVNLQKTYCHYLKVNSQLATQNKNFDYFGRKLKTLSS